MVTGALITSAAPCSSASCAVCARTCGLRSSTAHSEHRYRFLVKSRRLRNLADADAHDIGKALGITRPCAIADRVRTHHRSGFKAAVQRPQQSSSRRGDQLHLYMGGIHGGVFEQFRGRGRGYGKPSVGAVDEATPNIDGGAVPSVHIEGIGSRGGASDVYDGVDGTDFVEVNLFDGNTVDVALGLG